MKIITLILLAIIASTCTSNRNNLKQSLGGVSLEAPLKKGETCYQSTPDFANGPKKCASGLVCKKPVNPEGRTGLRSTCEPDVVIIGADKNSLAPLGKGEVCYQATPDFAKGKLNCAAGLSCQNPNNSDKSGERRMGAAWKCLPEPEPIVMGGETSSLGPASHGEVCDNSSIAPKYSFKRPCKKGLECRADPNLKDGLVGGSHICLPKDIIRLGGDGSSMGPAPEGEVCNKPSVHNWSGKRTCQPGLVCEADPSNNRPGADHICRSLIIGGDGSSLGPAPEGEVCNKPSVHNWSGKRTCQPGLSCEADPSNNRPGADHICRKLALIGGDGSSMGPAPEGEVCNKPSVHNWSGKRTCQPGLSCEADPSNNRPGADHICRKLALIGGDPNTQTPAFEGEVCDQPSVRNSPLKRKCYVNLECMPNPEDVIKGFTGGNHICLPKKSAITNIGGNGSSMGPAPEGEVCNKPSVHNWSGKRTCQKGLVCEADPSNNRPGADHICRKLALIGGDIASLGPAPKGEVCNKPSILNWPGKRACQKGLVCGPDPKNKRGETGGNYICL